MGVTGVALLYATWLSYLLLFTGLTLAAWLRLVVQNLVSSLLNSYLFDFHEGRLKRNQRARLAQIFFWPHVGSQADQASLWQRLS
jgi:hypothetical protein